MSEKLKPCPFCGLGGDRVSICNTDHGDGLAFYALCAGCAAEGPWGKHETTAVRLWNMRPREAELEAKCQEL